MKAYGTIFLTISALVYTVITGIAFFSKQKKDKIENRIFKNLLLLSVFSMLSELAIVFTVNTGDINKIFQKLYLIFIVLWLSRFMDYSYVSTIFDKNKSEKINIRECRNLHIFFIIFNIISIFLIILLPITFINTEDVKYTTGLCVYFVYALTAGYMIIMAIFLLTHLSKLKEKRIKPIFILLLLLSLTAIVQNNHPQLLLINAVFGLIINLLYNTIENPDLKLINELNVAKINLEKANNVKTDFLRSMSHEIRTPMNQIIGCASILEGEENLSEEGRETLHDLSTATNSLLDVCSGIINVSQIESGNASLEINEYNIEELLNETINLNSKLINGKDITLLKEYNNLPNKLYGDKEKVKQIVNNIFNNAVKYTEKGYVKLIVNSSIEEDICNLEIIVEDTGRGIKEENKDLIFDKFGRETKDSDKLGLGLGLTIAKSLVEMLDGKIEFTSIQGKGTTFTITIKQSTKEINNVDLTNKSLLLLHSSKILRTYMKKILEKYDIKVYEASKCKEALDFLNKNKCDVIITDNLIETEMSVKEFALISKTEIDLSFKIITLGRVKDSIDHDYEGTIYDGYISENPTENEMIDKIKEVLNGKRRTY